MAFPSTISTFNVVSGSDRLNSPSHSALHNSVSSVLTQVQTVIGTDSSVIGTIIGDLRNANSNGGGHVQTANKGGTGQTSFTKGDLLVATSASVLSKLASGSDGRFLKTNSSVAAGVEWSAAPGKITATASVFTYVYNNAFSNASLLSVNIPGSTLGTNNAIRAISYVNNYKAAGGGTGSVLLQAIYGGAVVASVMLRSSGNTPTGSSIIGKIECNLFANNSATIQRGVLNVELLSKAEDWSTTSSIQGIRTYNMNVSSVNSSANQVFGLVAYGGSSDEVSITIDGQTIEKIS